MIDAWAHRLLEISEDSARAEGFSSDPQLAEVNGEPGKVWIFEPRKWFLVEWDKLYGKRKGLRAKDNPWVWAGSFRVVS